MLERFKPFYTAGLRPFTHFFKHIGTHPDMLTLTGVVLFGIGGWLTIIGYWRVALLVGLAGAFMDGLDGELARQTNRKSLFGAILDSVSDRITEIIWLGSFLIYYSINDVDNKICIYLAFAAITGSLMVSYVKARAEGAGVKCEGGLLQRPERLIVLALFQFVGPDVMQWGLGIVTVLAYITVFQRLFIVWKFCKERENKY